MTPSSYYFTVSTTGYAGGTYDTNSNIHEILKAIEAILKITSVDIKEIRLDMDRLLAIYGEMGYLSP